MNWKAKNLLIYAASDLTGSLAKVMFEVRKQQIQMYNRDNTMSHLAKCTAIAWMPLMLRDVGFRSMLLSFYYLTTEIEHKPLLKYTVPQITDFMK